MIQDIEPGRLFNEYAPREISSGAIVCCFEGQSVLCRLREGALILPTWEELSSALAQSQYLFRIDEQDYYLGTLVPGAALPEGYGYDGVRAHRKLQPMQTVFAEMTAYHLYVWYRDNRFCGRCGSATEHDARQRMLLCPKCGNMIFPKICPAVIVGVTDGSRILLTKYAGRAYKNYALIAGFTEIGETAEQTVMREVYEETGVRVKDIRYWASQPWGVESDLLLGYFATLDGSSEIKMDSNELSLARWYERSEMQRPDNSISLTNDMILAFLENRHTRG